MRNLWFFAVLLLLLSISFAIAPTLSKTIVKTVADLDTGVTTATEPGYIPLQEGPTYISPPSTQLTIDSPLPIKSPVVLAPGDPLNVSFRTDYWCASGYTIQVFEQGTLGNEKNFVCERTTLSLGWTKGYAYGGIPTCARPNQYSNIVNDVCPISSNALDGVYAVRVGVYDYQGRLAVQQTIRNAITIVSPKPNLAVKEFKILSELEEKTAVDSGSVLKISADIENNGSISANNFEVKALLVDGEKETLIGSTAMSLQALEKKSIEFSFDSSEIAGTFVVKIAADPLNAIVEVNEKDNIGSGVLSISSGVANNPDLFVKSLKISPELEGVIGSNIEATAVIGNKGKQPASQFNVSMIRIENEKPIELSAKTVSGLNPDSEIELKFVYALKETAGNYFFGAMVDSSNQVTESFENNNQKTGNFIVIPLRIEQEELCYDGIDNDGDGVIDNGCEPDIQLSVKRIVPIKENENPIELNGGTFAALHSLDDFKIVLDSHTNFGDPKNTPAKTFFGTQLCVNIAKSDGSNALSLVFGAPNELKFESLKEFEISENYQKFAQDFYVLQSANWRVNGLEKPLPSGVASDYFYHNWITDGGFPVRPKTLGFDSGTYSVVFTANCNNSAQEFSQLKGNNTAGVTLQLPSAAETCNGIDDNLDGVVDEGCDLGIQSMQILNSPTLPACAMKTIVVVKNYGDKPLPANTAKLALYKNYLSGYPINSVNIPALLPEQTFNAEFLGTVPADQNSDMVLFAFADYLNNFKEFDDNPGASTQNNINNNIRREIVTVVSSVPSFVFANQEQLSLSDLIIKPPQSFSANVLVKNNGYVALPPMSGTITLTGSGLASTQTIPFTIPGIPANPSIAASCYSASVPSTGEGEVKKANDFSEANKISLASTNSSSSSFNNSNSSIIEKISFVGRTNSSIDSAGNEPPTIFLNYALPDSSNTAKLIVRTDRQALCRWSAQSQGYVYMPSANQMTSINAPVNPGVEDYLSAIVPAVDGVNKYYVSCANKDGSLPMDFGVLIYYENFPFISSQITIPSNNLNGKILLNACIGSKCIEKAIIATIKPNIALDLNSLIDEPVASAQGLRHIIRGRILNNGNADAVINFPLSFTVAAFSQRNVSSNNNYLCNAQNICYYCPGFSSLNDCKNSFGFSSVQNSGNISFAEAPSQQAPNPGGSQKVELGEAIVVIPSGTIPQNGFIDFSLPLFPDALAPGENQVQVQADGDSIVPDDNPSDNSGSVNLNGGEGWAFGNCTDGQDNDGDGRIDAQDPDCFFQEENPENFNCNNGIDDDGDGLVDSADPGCQLPINQEICGNGIDEDGDGIDAVCPPIELQPQTNSEGEICTDQIDNDNDGQVNEGCQTLEEICGNNIDDDLDGLVDEVPPCSVSLIEKPPVVPGIEVQISDTTINTGEYEFVTVVSQDGVPLNGALVKVITPSGKIFYLEVGPNGKINFIVEEDGEYTITVFFKGFEKVVKFRAVKSLLSQFGVIGEVASSVFGETVKENPWYIPLIGFLALLAAYLAFGLTQQIFEVPKASRQRMFLKAQAFIAALIFFLLPFLANKLVNFTAAMGVSILEIVLVFSLNYYFKEKSRKAGKMGKI